MPGELEIIAIMKPKPGKADRVQQLLADLSSHVKANEPGTLRYHLQRETRGETPTFVMLETYKDAGALKAHSASPQFKTFQKTLQEEGLMAEFKVHFTKGVAGFGSRL